VETVKGNIKLTSHIAANSYAAGATNGTAVDLSGFSNVSFFVSVGSVGAAGTLDVKSQYSDDDVNWTDDALSTTAGESIGNDISLPQITVAGEARLHIPNPVHRYYRLVATVGTNAVVFGVATALGGARHRPVSYS